jgi:hypothetical protein
MITVINVAAALVLLIAVWFVWSAARIYRNIRKTRDDLKWVHQQADRAVRQVNSTDRDSVLTGLQTLGALHVQNARLRVLNRVATLAKSDDDVVAKHASNTLEQMLVQVSDAAKQGTRTESK